MVIFIVSIVFILSEQKTNLSLMKKYVKIIVMPLEEDKILEFNQYMKSDKMSYIIYPDMESLI